MRPPRALWVSFPLGRPLGIPGDADFQHDVLRATFGMLSTATEPTIEDYPTNLPNDDYEAWACPLALEVDPDDSLGGRLLAEVGRLRPWAAETRRSRGRTLFGLSGAGPDGIDDVVTVLAEVAESGNVTELPDTDTDWAHPMPFLLRHLAEDLRSFYHEGIAAQPGDTPPNHDALNRWIFGETVLGEVLLTIGDHLSTAGDADPMALVTRNLMIPAGHFETDREN